MSVRRETENRDNSKSEQMKLKLVWHLVFVIYLKGLAGTTRPFSNREFLSIFPIKR